MGFWVPAGYNDYQWHVSNFSTQQPGAADGAVDGNGVVVTPGSNTKGSWVQLASGALIARDVFFMSLIFQAGVSAATAKDTIIDIGVDPAGGTSYTVLIPDLLSPGPGDMVGSTDIGPILYHFPLWVRAGSTLAVRASQNGGPITFKAGVYLQGSPRDRSLVRVGTRVTAFGITAATSKGTAVTPGTTSIGTFTALATGIAREAWWWQLGVGINDSSITSGNIYSADLAFGSSTSANHTIIEGQLIAAPTANEVIRNDGRAVGCARKVPAGSNLYGRLWCSGTADSNLSMAAYGLGG